MRHKDPYLQLPCLIPNSCSAEYNPLLVTNHLGTVPNSVTTPWLVRLVVSALPASSLELQDRFTSGSIGDKTDLSVIACGPLSKTQSRPGNGLGWTSHSSSS